VLAVQPHLVKEITVGLVVEVVMGLVVVVVAQVGLDQMVLVVEQMAVMEETVRLQALADQVSPMLVVVVEDVQTLLA